MKQQFDEVIKNIEDELLALKTASKYASIRSSQFSASTMVRTGLYRITYESASDEIFSLVYCGVSGSDWGLAFARTPINNTQVVEVVTDVINEQTQDWETFSAPLAVVSNVPVVNITRIS